MPCPRDCTIQLSHDVTVDVLRSCLMFNVTRLYFSQGYGMETIARFRFSPIMRMIFSLLRKECTINISYRYGDELFLHIGLLHLALNDLKKDPNLLIDKNYSSLITCLILDYKGSTLQNKDHMKRVLFLCDLSQDIIDKARNGYIVFNDSVRYFKEHELLSWLGERNFFLGSKDHELTIINGVLSTIYVTLDVELAKNNCVLQPRIESRVIIDDISDPVIEYEMEQLMSD